jgi:hypothetical protein
MILKLVLRLMCALEGKYLVCEDAHESTDHYSKELDELQCIQFSCSVPVTNGRGFIEVLFSSFSLTNYQHKKVGRLYGLSCYSIRR